MAAKLTLYLLLLSSFNYLSDSAIPSDSRATNFIKASCRATRYPVLCIQSLSSYGNFIQQSEQQLAQAALSVSLSQARSTTVFVSKFARVSGIKPREYQAVKDCIEMMGDTVDQLSRSIKELNQMGQFRGQAFMWHMSNVQTWVSAALTNENTCVDGFSGRFMEGGIKAAIKQRVVGVAQVTSNALAFVNRLADRHKAAEVTNLP